MDAPKLLRVLLGVALSLTLIFALSACGADSTEDEEYESDPDAIATEVSTLPSIRIAALESDDLLPTKVAESEGLFYIRGLKVDVLTFATVEEQHEAFIAGESDALISDMADLALLTSDELIVYAVAVVQDDGGSKKSSLETDNTLHRSLFTLPDDALSERVIAFSQEFLLGNAASGEQTSPEASAEAVNMFIGAVAQAVGQINSAAHDYLELYLEQGVVAHYLYDEPVLPTYPFPELPDREEGEALLRWLLDNDKLGRSMGYDDLIFVPIAP